MTSYPKRLFQFNFLLIACFAFNICFAINDSNFKHKIRIDNPKTVSSVLGVEEISYPNISESFKFNCDSIGITIDTTGSFIDRDLLNESQGEIVDLCVGEEFTITILNLNPAEDLQYQWYASDNFISGGENTSSPTFSPSTEGIFGVLLVTTNQQGCRRRDQLNFSVHAITDVEILVTEKDQDGNDISTVLSDSIFLNCNSNSEFTLSRVGVSNTGDVLIEWRNGNNELISNAPEVSIEPGPNEFFSLTLTDIFGCYASQSIQFIGEPVDYIPTNSLSDNEILNLDDDSELEFCISFSNPNFAIDLNTDDDLEFLWSGDIVQGNHTTNSPLLSPPTPGSYLVNLLVTNQYGCVYEYDFDLFIHDNDEEQLISYTQECGSLMVNFEAPNTDFNFYSWLIIDNDNFEKFTEQSINFEFDESGEYEVRLIPTVDNNCNLPEINRFVEVREPLADIILEANYLECKEDTLWVQFSNANSSFQESLNFEWQFSNGQTSFSESPIIQFSSEGSFQVNLLLSDNFDCTVSDSLSIDVALLNTEVVQDSIVICNEERDIELNPNGSSDLVYVWASNDYFTNLNQSNPIISPSESEVFEVKITQIFENYSCHANSQIEVIVAPEINSIVDVQGVIQSSIIHKETSLDIFLCDTSLDPFTLIAPFSENAIYRWYSHPSLSSEFLISQNQNLEIDPVLNNSNTIFLEVEVRGCISNPFRVNLIYETKPELDIVSEYITSSGCGPGTLQLLASETSNSSAIISYLWEGPNGYTSNVASPFLFVNGPENNGEYRLTVLTKGGCNEIINLNVNEITPVILPNPTIMLEGNQCEGEELVLSLDQDYALEAVYTWTAPSNINVSGQNTAQLTISSFDDSEHFGKYTLQVMVDTCISNVDTFLIEPLANISLPTSELCQGTDLNLNLFSSTGISFQWSGPNNFSSTEKSPWINEVSELDNGLYTVDILDATGCLTTLVAVVDNILPNAPNGNVSVVGPICQGNDIVLSTDAIGDQYEWISPLGLNDENQDIEGLITTQSTTRIKESSSAYLPGDWKVMVTDGSGCSSISDAVIVNITAQSVATILGDETVCEGESLKLFAATVEDADYKWFLEDATSELNNVSDTQAFEIQNIEAGFYTISLEVSKNGCPSELSTKSFLISNRPTASPDFSIVSTANCNIYDVILSSNVNSDEEFTYHWSGPNGFESSEPEPIITDVSSSDLGVYALEIVNANNCASNTHTIGLTELPEPITDPVIIQNGESCKGDSVDLIATEYDESSVIYTWYGPAGILSIDSTSDNRFTISNFEDIDSGIYWVSVALDNCVLSSQNIEISVQDIPEINLSTSGNSICAGDILIIESNTVNTSTFQWIGPNGFTSDSETIEISNIDDSYNGTYSLMATAPSGCSAQEDIQIDFIPETMVSPQLITSNTCNGESLLLSTEFTGSNYVWVSPLGNTSNLPELNALNTTDNFIVIDSEDFYYLEGYWKVIVTNEEGCEFTSDLINVSFQQNSVPSILVNESPCKGEDILLSTNTEGDNFEWTFEPNNTNFPIVKLNTQTNSLLVTPQNEAYLEGAWSLIVSSSNGCITPSSTIFVQFANVESPIASNTGPYCSEQSTIQLLSNSIPSALYTWYQGNPSTNGIPISNEQNPSIEINTDGDTIHYFLVISQNGCSSLPSPTEVIFSEELVIEPTAEAILEEDCSLNELRLTSNTVGSGPFIHNWTGPNNFTSSDANPIVTPVESLDLSGTYTLQVLDVNNCEVSSTTFINIENEILTPSIIINQTQLCVGDALSISTSTVSGSESSYLWTGPLGNSLDGIYSNTEALLFSEVSLEDAGQYTVSVLVDGCQSGVSESITIEVNEAPAIDLPSTINACFDATTNITLPLSIIEGQGPFTYNWEGPNQFQSNVQRPVINNLSSENGGFYTVYAISASGCRSETMQVLVDLEEIPQTPIIGTTAQTLCEGEDLILTINNFNPNQAYTWTFESGLSIQHMDSILVIDGAQITTHDGMVSVFSTNGNCTSAISENISINIIPRPEVINISNTSEASPACFGEAVQLIGPEIPGASYTWTGPNNFTSNAMDVNLENTTPMDAGTYTLVIEVNGCLSETAQTEVILQTIPATPTINPIDSVCEGSDVFIELLLTDSSLTYEWFITELNQSISEGTTLTFQNINLDAAGTYYVVASSPYCSSDASPPIQVIIESMGESNAFAGQDTMVCQPDFLLGQDTMQQLGGTWSLLGDTSITTILNPEEYTGFVVDLQEGVNELVWTVDAAICMENTVDTISISYLPSPLAIDDEYKVVLNGETMNDITLNDLLVTSEVRVSLLSPPMMGTFDLLDGGHSLYVPNENFIGIDSIEYLVCYEFCPADCDSATAIFNVGEESECFIPSVFTPNGDGVNDYFTIPFLSKFPQSTIYIYNRWGDEVYHTDNYQGEWEGTYKGGSLPTGTYYYILEVNDEEQNTKIGYIFIQR